MASIQDVIGVNQTLAEAGGLSNQMAAGLHAANVKVMQDTYVADATEAAGSTIKLCGPLPTGAKIIAIILTAGTAQAALTCSVGNSSDAAAYRAAGATGLQTVEVPTICHGAGVVVGTADGDDEILITTAAATMTAGTIYCAVLYSTD